VKYDPRLDHVLARMRAPFEWRPPWARSIRIVEAAVLAAMAAYFVMAVVGVIAF
jgi:hypothetical protein